MFNSKKYVLCFLKFNHLIIKDVLSDIIVEGVVNITKGGFGNPVSTFFANILIIEGP